MKTIKINILIYIHFVVLFIVVEAGFAIPKTEIPGAKQPIRIESLLASSQMINDVECNPSKGLRFSSDKNSSWKVKGSMPNKSGTIVLRPEAGTWDLSAFSYFRIDLVNTGPGLVWIRGRLDNPGAKDWDNSTSSVAFIMPGERATLGFPYPRSEVSNDAPELFSKQSGKPNGHRTHWKAFDPANVKGCRLVVQSTSSKISLEQITVSVAQPYGAEANAQLLELPFLDPFGQVRQLDWPGKLHAEKELVLRRKAEELVIAADGGPAAFNQFGGWLKGPQLEATGFFRTEKVDEKWWLVDPDGRLFFSHGVNSVGFGQSTPVEGRKALFEWLPTGADPLMEGVLSKSRAHFMMANVARTFGPEWMAPANERVHQRLRRWGMNTLGAWSSPELAKDGRTPYTAILHVGHEYSVLKHGLSDPFSNAFKNQLQGGLKKLLGPEGKDPWCIGVFIDNELGWTQKFVHTAFSTGPKQPVRQELIKWLEEKYKTIDKLNQAWDSDFDSWSMISTLPLENQTADLQMDILALRRKIAEEYYKTCRDVMRDVLPNHLYLGSRMHNAPEEVLRASAEYVDVLSLNSYEPLSGSKVPAWLDKACMDTEFHFAAPDRGVLGVGLMPVGDQMQRSRSYVAYVTAGLMHPNMVGTHWFAYADQSAAGRPGENYQIGFVDVTDTPYPAITQASRAMANRMYAIRASESTDLLVTLEALWREE